MQKLILILFLFVGTTLAAQEYRFAIQGQIFDDNYSLIPEVVVSFNKSNQKIYLDHSGSFHFKYKYQKDDYIIFNCIGFEADTLHISERQAKKSNKKKHWKINIKLTPVQFEEVVIIAQKVDTVFGSKLFSIYDYLFIDDDKLLLLTYDKRITKAAKLLLTNNEQEEISSYSIPDEPKYLYTDYANNNYLVCKYKIYEIVIKKEEIELTPITKEDFYGFYNRIIDTIGNNYYYSNYTELYPAVDFLVSNRLDSSSHSNLATVQDDFMMELYRAEYKYVSGREKLWAYRKEQKTGIDKEIWIGAKYFTHDFLYKKIYAPLFVKNDTLILFDQYKKLIIRFDSDHDKIDSTHFDLKIKRSQGKWQQPLIRDKVTGEIYALYNKGGYSFLKLIDTETGEATKTLKLNNKYVERLTIVNNSIYYIYHPFETMQKKFLYREEVILNK